MFFTIFRFLNPKFKSFYFYFLFYTDKECAFSVCFSVKQFQLASDPQACGQSARLSLKSKAILVQDC